MRGVFGFVICWIVIVLAQPALASCLTADRTFGWVNVCSNPVQVRWTDEGSCKNWSCSTNVPARGRNTTYFKGMVTWCECDTPACFPGQGPSCR
jgi:hypothetical protein